MKKIVLSHNIPCDTIRKKLSEYTLVYPEKDGQAFTREEIEKQITDAEILIVFSEYKCDKSLVELGSKLKIIANLGVGYNNIDIAAAEARRIFVLNTPKSVTDPTAEMTIALMLAVSRSVVLYDRNLREDRLIKPSLFFERDMVLSGKTLGVLGFGRIGKSVAKKASGLGMRIMYYDLFPQTEVDGAVFCRPEELLGAADVVSLHFPYMPEYHHYINAERLSLMKPSAYLINAARGPLIDEKALIHALKEKRLRGAALDVHEFEPRISEEIAALSNIVITPHCCTNIYDVRMSMLDELINGIIQFTQGMIPGNSVTHF